jgi:hypothetical protein
MYICEYAFLRPDRDNPKYSQLELDFYNHIPRRDMGDRELVLKNHRLSLRKNLTIDTFELFKEIHHNKEKQIVLRTKDLQEALDKGKELYEVFWNEEMKRDIACKHNKGEKDRICMKDFYTIEDDKGNLHILSKGLIN